MATLHSPFPQLWEPWLPGRLQNIAKGRPGFTAVGKAVGTEDLRKLKSFGWLVMSSWVLASQVQELCTLKLILQTCCWGGRVDFIKEPGKENQSGAIGKY